MVAAGILGLSKTCRNTDFVDSFEQLWVSGFPVGIWLFGIRRFSLGFGSCGEFCVGQNPNLKLVNLEVKP